MRYIDLKVMSSDIVHLKGLNLNPVPLTRGSVNDIACRFEFSSHWDKFGIRTAVFSGSEQTKAVIIEDNMALIPWECLTLAGGEVRVGVVGMTSDDENDESYALINSEEICIGTIISSADVNAAYSEAPTPTLAEQLLLKFEHAENKVATYPDITVGKSGNIVQFDSQGGLSDSNVAIKDLARKSSVDSHLTKRIQDTSGIHGIRLYRGILQTLKNEVWTNYVCPSDHDSPLPSKDIDPVFANNSWEDIAIVARYKDPSRYWKVGDYKEIDMPFYSFEIGEMKDVNFFNRDRFLKVTNFRQGTYNVTFVNDDIFGLIPKITSGGFSYVDQDGTLEFDFVKNYDSETEIYSTDAFIKDMKVTKTYKKVPAQIIGFNHDDVSFPNSYGKTKAGLTLMLGCTSSFYGNKVGVYDNYIPHCSVSMDDTHIVSPNTVDTSGNKTDTGTNWASGGFRYYLSEHLEMHLPEELSKNVCCVNKLSSRLFSAKNYYRDMRVTKDFYFLLSEYEVFGEQIVTKAIEGEQYRFFKEGNSKIVMTPEIRDAVLGIEYDTYTNSRLWLRSVDSKYTDPYLPSENFYGMTSNYTSNPNYTNDGLNKRTNSILLSYNYDSKKYNFQSGGAYSNNIPAYIAPCFCL